MLTLVVKLVRRVLSAKFTIHICCCWGNPWCDCHVTHIPKCNEPAKTQGNYNCGLKNWLSFCFPCATYEIRRSLDLALLTNQNGRYFYKMHLATLPQGRIMTLMQQWRLEVS